jgi:hypothetical protein
MAVIELMGRAWGAVAISVAPIGMSVGRVVFGVVLVGVLIGFAVICAMKGKWVFFALGFFSGVFWIIGALRLGKPKSYWAGRRYGDLKIAEAERRFSRRRSHST